MAVGRVKNGKGRSQGVDGSWLGSATCAQSIYSKQGSAPADLISNVSQTLLPGCRSGDGTSGRREVLGRDNAIHSWIMNLDFSIECAWEMRNLLVTGIVHIEENRRSFMWVLMSLVIEEFDFHLINNKQSSICPFQLPFQLLVLILQRK